MIERTLSVLAEDNTVDVRHLDFQFTDTLSQARRISWRKILQLPIVVVRLLRIRRHGPIDLALYPIGGPHLVPIVRDLALLPFFLLACRKVSLNIHAGGIAEKLPDLPSPIRMLAKFVYGQCDEAVVLTEFSRQDAEALGIKQIAVLPNRLQDSYDPAKVARTATSAELLYVGHFSDLKGVPNLLHAVAQLRHENPDIRLNLVGEPLWPLTEEEVASMIDKLGLNEIVRLKGLQLGDTKWTSYATADLLVFPSTALESFPLVLLEAMMWGLPVVATDWRAHSEILGPDPGGVCYPVDEDPRKALTGALAQALGQRSRWKEWGERNRARYTAMDSIEPDPLISYARRAVEA